MKTERASLVKRKNAWDRELGYTLDIPGRRRGSLVYDALYHLIGNEEIRQECRSGTDKGLIRIHINIEALMEKNYVEVLSRISTRY